MDNLDAWLNQIEEETGWQPEPEAEIDFFLVIRSMGLHSEEGHTHMATFLGINGDDEQIETNFKLDCMTLGSLFFSLNTIVHQLRHMGAEEIEGTP